MRIPVSDAPYKNSAPDKEKQPDLVVNQDPLEDPLKLVTSASDTVTPASGIASSLNGGNQSAFPSCALIEQRYEVTRLLGTGGMGAVYQAKHRLLPKSVAIKVLNGKLLPDDSNRLRFEQEAKAVAALNHSNIPGVHDFGIADDGSPFMVMDYIDGQSLKDVIDLKGGLDSATFINIFTQLASALQHAHSKGIVHRDIKPANIMLINEENRDLVKLVDFGISTLLDGSEAGSPLALTQEGGFIGSPLYISPEQIRGQKVDARADVYLLGSTMYEALTGKPPFKSETAIATMLQHLENQPPPFQEAAPTLTISPELEKIVMKCLEKDPEKRFQSAAELKQSLQVAASSEAASSTFAKSKEDLAISPNSIGVYAEGGYVKAEPRRKWHLLISMLAAVATMGLIFVAVSPHESKPSAQSSSVIADNTSAQPLTAQQSRELIDRLVRQFSKQKELVSKHSLAAAEVLDEAITSLQLRRESDDGKVLDASVAQRLMERGDHLRMNLRDPDSAGLLYDGAESVLRAIGDLESLLGGNILLREGTSHLNDVAKSKKLFEQSLAIKQKSGDSDLALAEVLGWIGSAELQLKNFEKAAQIFSDCKSKLRPSETIQSKQRLMNALKLHADALLALGKNDDALKVAKEFIVLADALRATNPTDVYEPNAAQMQKLVTRFGK